MGDENEFTRLRMVPTKIPIVITKNKLILVEGIDEEVILRCFLKKMKIKNIQVEAVGTTPKSGEISDIAKIPNFKKKVKSIGIIRDADHHPERAFESIQTALKNAQLPVPLEPLSPIDKNDKKVNVYIAPNGKDSKGMIETLFVESIKGDPIYQKCIESFLDCGENVVGHSLGEKSPAYAYIALQKYPDIRLGISVQQKCWNLDHPVFDNLKAFIKSI